MKQTLKWNSNSTVIKDALARFEKENFVQRLWDKDTTLWSQEAEEQKTIDNRLGWMRVPGMLAADNARLKALAARAKDQGVAHVVLLGMGGSSLFADVCRETFGSLNLGIPMSVLDTTDATQIESVRNLAAADKTWIVVSSKSGTTAESLALLQHFWGWFEKAGLTAGEHCIAVTDSGTPLEALANEKQFQEVFVLDQALGSDVGGRFAALTYFGLVPAVLQGLDIDKLLASALKLYDQCGAGQPLAQNTAAELAAYTIALGQSGRNKLSLLCAPAIASFGTWGEQLVAESTGKKGQGIVPVVGETLHAIDQYGNDRAFIEMQITSAIDTKVREQAEKLVAAGHPVLSIEWTDRYELGAEVAKWSLATAWMGALLGYNPFDEPNVWETKNKTNAFLADFAEKGKVDEGQAVLVEKDVAVYVDNSDVEVTQANDLKSVLTAFLRQAKAGDYLGLLNFLPRTSAIDESVISIGNRLGNQLRVAPTVEFGPRYLHSTGQLHKGGPNTGLFVVLTGSADNDLDIPGQPYDFNVLKFAQALGDCQALRDNSRRLLRLHLTGRMESTVQKLRQTLDEVIKELDTAKA